MIEYINKILIPFITEKRKELKLSADYPALVLFDTFKGQCSDDYLTGTAFCMSSFLQTAQINYSH